MKRIAAVFAMIICAVVYSNAQTKAVTNAELEKYRARRIAAAADLQQKFA